MSHSVILKFSLFAIIIIFVSNVLVAQRIEGFVFVDANKNSIMDKDEKGLNGVMVSNQKEVVITNEAGYFSIKAIEGNYIYVTKPETYQFKLDQFNNPEFYFLFKSKRIKEDLHYPESEIIQEKPEVLYFPVYENIGEENHSSLIIGDPQVYDDKQLGYYERGIIPLMGAKQADFYIMLGDIANNRLEMLPKEKKVSATMGIPGYRVFGNHDMNYRATVNKHASTTFKNYYGPDYYSFDYGKFHYVVLNNVIYEGWKKEEHAFGEYHGGISGTQKKWLANDLALVPQGKTIVLLSHIPLHENFVLKSDMKILFKTLEPHKKIFALSGHFHSIIAYDYSKFNEDRKSADFEGLVAGAVCGSFWTGPLDENGIPNATCSDGSPKGFFQLNTNRADYNYEFHSATQPYDAQMRAYINNDEIWVNWFVGKRKDSVWVFIDDNPEAIVLQNFIGKDLFIDTGYLIGGNNDAIMHEPSETAHLWKIKLPDWLSAGQHAFKITAKDSKGKLFELNKKIQINKKPTP